MEFNYVEGQTRNELHYGLTVDIVLKENQKSGVLTRGKIEDILTNKAFHSRGIKVRLQADAEGVEHVGRVQAIVGYEV